MLGVEGGWRKLELEDSGLGGVTWQWWSSEYLKFVCSIRRLRCERIERVRNGDDDMVIVHGGTAVDGVVVNIESIQQKCKCKPNYSLAGDAETSTILMQSNRAGSLR
jgi:hypothetical protein